MYKHGAVLKTYYGYAKFILGEEKAKKFYNWAFGEDYAKDREIRELAKDWNVLHGEKYKINLRSNPIEDLEKMIEIWKNIKSCN